MELRDTMGDRESGAAGQEGRVVIDRFEMTHVFSEREEEEKVEAAMALYEKAARARMPGDPPEAPDSTKSEEELEAMSQELKLRQKCQDIAALVMVDELEEELEEEDEPKPRKKHREE